MITLTDIQRVRGEIHRLANKHGIVKLRVFGSVARGEQNALSDVDLLVRIAPSSDLIDLISFKKEAEALLGCQVDVVSENGISPHLRNKIFAEALSV